jgi:hypothetical protein
MGQPFTRLGNFTTLLCAIGLGMLTAPAARASDPIGIYGFVDRVVFEPNDTAPERIQVWGGFALAKKAVNNSEYNDAERGYLYFKLRPGQEEVCKKEWADLKSVAGDETNRVVRHTLRGYATDIAQVRRESGKPGRVSAIVGHDESEYPGLRAAQATREAHGKVGQGIAQGRCHATGETVTACAGCAQVRKN